jgi:hypothetical protein
MALATSVASASRRGREFDEVGGRTCGRGRRTHPVAQALDGGADLGSIFRNQRELLALEFEDVAAVAGNHVTGDLLEGFGRDAGDFGEAEIGVAELIVLQDEVIGVAATDVSVVVAELFPGEAEVIEHVGIADLFEARGAGGATADDDGEGILETGPGAEITLFFATHGVFSHRSMRDWEKPCCKQGS